MAAVVAGAGFARSEARAAPMQIKPKAGSIIADRIRERALRGLGLGMI
jgi:hypothetical protein